MLGLADRTRVIDLFEALMRADMAAALDELRGQYDSGADPAMVLGDLAEFTHFVTRVKVVPSSRRRRVADRGRAHPRPRLCDKTLDAGIGALLADAAQGHRRGRSRRPADRRRRDGLGAHRLCRRPADARRGDPFARRYARRQWRRAPPRPTCKRRSTRPDTARSELRGGRAAPLASAAAPMAAPQPSGARSRRPRGDAIVKSVRAIKALRI